MKWEHVCTTIEIENKLNPKPSTLNKSQLTLNWGRNSPTPMTALVLFGMNSSSSQLLDMLQALSLVNYFFPSFTPRLPILKIYSIAQAFQTPTTYLHPIKNPKPSCHSRAKVILQSIQCYRSNVEVLLQKTMLHRRVEAMLQKCCWSDVAENFVKVVLQKTFLLKKVVHLWQVSVHQPFFLFAYFSLLFFCLDVVDDDEPAYLIVVLYT